jgi:S1-C subfamily serine protease
VYDAILVGTYKEKDLAVIRINAPPEQLQPVLLGSSTGVRVGQTTFAIGNPFGFDHTLTTGVVSGLDREIQSQVGSVITGGIQTDAAINPGNSGTRFSKINKIRVFRVSGV